eukprot:jgi/Tetstr1/454667/TSEL_041557.t1
MASCGEGGEAATVAARQAEPSAGPSPRIQALAGGGDGGDGIGNETAWASYETVFTNAKAGMDGVDRDKVKQVVYEMSKDSAYFQNEQRKQEATGRRVEELRRRAETLSEAQLAAHTRAADAQLAQLDLERRLDKVWLHVDMDAFYAAVEERDNPSLKDKAMAVGGTGMITTANYNARAFGVRSAMPGFIAKRLCPKLVFVRPDFAKYSAAAEETRAVFREYDPDFQAGSLDEAYLHMTDAVAQRGLSGQQLAQELRERVQSRTGLTCSVGIAPNKRLAKVCSDMNKPNGQFEVAPTRSAVMAFMQSLPIRKVGGVGKVAEQALSQILGVNTCGQLLTHRGAIVALFSPKAAHFYLEIALGLGATEHAPRPGDGEVGRKGISVERTFGAIAGRADMEHKLRELAAHLAADMAKEDLRGRTLTLKLKTSEFRVHTRACSTQHWLTGAPEILPVAMRLLSAEREKHEGLSLRLMGLRMSGLMKRHSGRVAADPGQATLASFVSAEAGQLAEDAPDERAAEAPATPPAPSAAADEPGPPPPPSSTPGSAARAVGRQGRGRGRGPSEAWECRICTLRNPGILLRCAACEAHRSSSSIHDVCNAGLLADASALAATSAGGCRPGKRREAPPGKPHKAPDARRRRGGGAGSNPSEHGGIQAWLSRPA